MKQIFQQGETREYSVTVGPDDVARFQNETVHEVYSTFALARDVEWTTRQFVLDMVEDDEEGVGTYLEIFHRAPAFVNDVVNIVGRVEEFKDGELSCSFTAHVGSRLIADGKTGQKILSKEKIKLIFAHG